MTVGILTLSVAAASRIFCQASLTSAASFDASASESSVGTEFHIANPT